MGKVIVIERDDFGDLMEYSVKLKNNLKEVMHHIEQLDRTKVNKELLEELEEYAAKSDKYAKKMCKVLEEAAEESAMNERRNMMGRRDDMGERYNGLGMNERRHYGMGRRDDEDDYRNTIDPRHGGERSTQRGYYRD